MTTTNNGLGICVGRIVLMDLLAFEAENFSLFYLKVQIYWHPS